MQCVRKKEGNNLIDVENVETTYFDKCAFFAAFAFFLLHYCLLHLSLLLSHSVQLSSPSSLVCSLFYPVGVIRLNIATTSPSRFKFVLYPFKGHCTILRCHHVMCS